MKQALASLAVVLALALSACSDGGGLFGHPKITEQEIATDIVGRRTGEYPLAWTFAKDEPKEIQLLQSDYSGDKATIVIHMNTETAQTAPQIWLKESKEKMAGKLRLHYEWVADQWTLVRVESLDFKK